MRDNLAEHRDSGNGILSEASRVAILDTYMRLHGPTTEPRLAAVLQAATDAAIALACFQMTMAGRLIPECRNGDVAFQNAPTGRMPFEHIGEIMRRIFKEVGHDGH